MGCVLPCGDDYEEFPDKELEQEETAAVEASKTSVQPAEEIKEATVPPKTAVKKGKKDLEIIITPTKPDQGPMVDVLTPVNSSPKVTVTTPLNVRNLINKFDLGDQNSPVYKGTVALQKFSNKSTYDQRFMWVNLHNQTLNLSEHMTKDKRHKEVGIKDITFVAQQLPKKYTADKKRDTEKIDVDQCLTVSFTKGGGIDVRFTTNEERDLWVNALNKLMTNTPR